MPENNKKGGQRAVLVVDDLADMRLVCKEVFRREGYLVYEAENGKVAFDMLNSGLKIDAVISDIAMPVMDGLTLAEKIVKAGLNIPICLCTGSIIVTARFAKEKGADAFLSKPFDMKELLRIIAKLIDLRRSLNP